MDEHYLEKPQDLKRNPEGKLAAFIQSQGGVSGLAGNANTASKDAELDVGSSRDRSRVNKAKSARVQAEISRQALTQLKTSKGIGSVATKEPIRVGNSGLLVLLARREPRSRHHQSRCSDETLRPLFHDKISPQPRAHPYWIASHRLAGQKDDGALSTLIAGARKLLIGTCSVRQGRHH
jgi:hypothetical protein